jgi:glutamate synthase domain-containing protein 3
VSAAPVPLDLAALGVRGVNARLQEAPPGERFRVLHPDAEHNLAVGLRAPIEVDVEGHAGYYAAGMNELATVRFAGGCGVGAGENMMSGRVEIGAGAAAAAAASARGGLLAVRGDAGARCAISLKGADVVVTGSVGHSCGFMAQSGRVVVCGDAGEGLGDSLYEARIYVRGAVGSLGADCVEKELRDEHREELGELLADAGMPAETAGFRRFGSARRLYHFQPRPAGAAVSVGAP